jgi:hypothetical protein
VTLVYATPDDLAAWTGTTAPANATALLRSASLLVREATRNCFYATDGTGQPTDTATLAAFKDATTAQAAFWAANSIDPVAVFTPAQIVNQKSIGSARLGYDTAGAGSVAAYQARVQAAQELCADAVRILQDANLQLHGVWVVG